MKLVGKSDGRPRPGPLPPREGELSSGCQRIERGWKFVRRALLFPLPGGEGKGEGERSTYFSSNRSFGSGNHFVRIAPMRM